MSHSFLWETHGSIRSKFLDVKRSCSYSGLCCESWVLQSLQAAQGTPPPRSPLQDEEQPQPVASSENAMSGRHFGNRMEILDF